MARNRYTKTQIQTIEQEADIRDFVPDLKGMGISRYTKCPECGKTGKGKGLIVSHKKGRNGQTENIAKCFSCGYTIVGAINAYRKFVRDDFLEAVEQVAKQSGVNIMQEPQKSDESKKKRLSFCNIQLQQSGLTEKDVLVRVPVKGTSDFILQSPFRSGGMDSSGNFNDRDDEMLIHYYDLDGNPVMFASKTGSKMRPYIRVRWSNPALHKGMDDKPTKYQTPKGAPAIFYITEFIRDKYRKAEQLNYIVIQEGEKKAEKACKHGIPSIGIQGIYNIGNAESGLIKELQYIIQKCKVKKVIMMMDADWDHLNRNIEPGDHIDQRPKQFAGAVIKFRDYVSTLHTLGLSVDIYFGHINENEKGDKGIDDLLVNTLRKNESELKEDIEKTLYTHNGKGRYVNIHKVTSKTDNQIRDYWLLNSKEEFFSKYNDRISTLQTFRFGRITYVNEDGKFKEAIRNAADSNFWHVSESESGKKSMEFDYIGAFDFLQANSFFRIQTPEMKKGEYSFVKIDDFIVRETSPADIRDFVYQYVLQNTKSNIVRQSFAASLGRYLGLDKLERLRRIDDNFSEPQRSIQFYYYRNGRVQITADKIEFGPHLENVWEEKLVKRQFKRVRIFDSVFKDDHGFHFNLTQEGEKCEFLRFLINTCNFWKGREQTMTDQDEAAFNQHFVNKITAIGYLLSEYRPRSEQKAVIAMDAKMDEVSKSNGRSGKSLIGVAISMLIPQALVKGRNASSDDYIYSDVSSRTRNVFIDDVNVNFDFTQFYQDLTSDLIINPKLGGRFKLEYAKCPKFYITTNHSLNDNSDSGRDRRLLLSFSDYYNTDWKPEQEFGHTFFDMWEDEQWCLFDNLMMECVSVYFQSRELEWHRKGCGMVPPPMEQLELRALRQLMGESFLQWADEYFDPQGMNINRRIERKEMMNAYCSEYPSKNTFMTPAAFRKKMEYYCRFRGYNFNPNSRDEQERTYTQWKEAGQPGSFIGKGYKSNSKEFFMVATQDYTESQPF